MIATLQTLLERLQNADGPDREIDAAIAVTTFVTVRSDEDLVTARKTYAADHCAPGTYWISQRSGLSLRTAEPYTNSLDASIELVERLYPDWNWCVKKRADTAIGYINNNESHFVGIAARPNPKKRWHEERHPTSPTVALLTALVQALIAEQE